MSHSTVGALSPRRLDNMPGIRLRRLENPPPRNEPFSQVPGYHVPAARTVVGGIQKLLKLRSLLRCQNQRYRMVSLGTGKILAQRLLHPRFLSRTQRGKCLLFWIDVRTFTYAPDRKREVKLPPVRDLVCESTFLYL